MCEDRSFESILKNAGVYTISLELEILRHYEELRKKILTPYNKLQAENERLLKCESDIRKIHEGYMKAVRDANMCFQYIDGTLMLLNRL